MNTLRHLIDPATAPPWMAAIVVLILLLLVFRLVRLARRMCSKKENQRTHITKAP